MAAKPKEKPEWKEKFRPYDRICAPCGEPFIVTMLGQEACSRRCCDALRQLKELPEDKRLGR